MDKLLLLVDGHKINFTLPDEAFGYNDEITVTGGFVKQGMIYMVSSVVIYFVALLLFSIFISLTFHFCHVLFSLSWVFVASLI